VQPPSDLAARAVLAAERNRAVAAGLSPADRTGNRKPPLQGGNAPAGGQRARSGAGWRCAGVSIRPTPLWGRGARGISPHCAANYPIWWHPGGNSQYTVCLTDLVKSATVAVAAKTL